MKILIAHNRYQQVGGEDSVVQSEFELLKKFKEDVYLYERTNHEINSYSLSKKLGFVAEMNWSRKSYQEMKKVLKEFRPDVVHFHNIFFMISPSVFYACREENVPVVQSQHNFRLLCSNGLFFRDNRVCEECLPRSLWHGIIHRCYKNSLVITMLAVWMLERNWKKGTWKDLVDCYITATEFSRQKYIAGGISPEKIRVKPHFLNASPKRREDLGNYALYVGRLSPEKGVRILLEAWRHIKDIPLKIMGSGPSHNALRSFTAEERMDNVEFLGYLTQDQYADYMKKAKFIVVPSICYENFPRIVVEAYAFGVPILASRLGTMADLVKNKETGLLFEAGNAQDLREKAVWLARQENLLKTMGENAHKEFENKYTAEKNYAILTSIYQETIKNYHKNRK